MRYTTSERTKAWLVDEMYPSLHPDDAALLQAAVMFYVLAGWEDVYPYPDMPEWLKPRWWHPVAETAQA